MEDQIAENITNGMSREEAEGRAVVDMGDPVDVGISLDKIHKPQIAWRILVIVGALSILGILLQQSIFSRLSRYEGEALNPQYDFGTMSSFVLSVALGFVAMCLLYFIDYTVIAKYAKLVGLGIIGIGVFGLLLGNTVNGVHRFVGVGRVHINLTAVMMFYVPIYGAILYKYRGGGLRKLLISVLWLIAPVFITYKIPNLSVAGIMLICMLVQLSVALLKGWFNVPVKRTLMILWAAFICLPIVSAVLMYTLHLLNGYREARIRAFLTRSGDGNYLTSILREFNTQLSLIGNSGKDVIGSVPDLNRDYIFSYILNSYGRLAGMVIVAVLATLIIFMFAASVKQKNEVGLVMGCGCGMLFFMNTSINLLGVFGVVPPMASFLPFFSAGGSNLVLSYALIGIILSIYRYKDIYPKHVKTKWHQMKITFYL